LPNHFHIIVLIKPEEVILKCFEQVKNKAFDLKEHSLVDFIMERFSNFLNGYTKAFNKMYNRKGALFMDYLKRSRAINDRDFSAFLFYIHKNAVHHGYKKEIGKWKFDSYNSLLSDSPTSLLRDDVINFFGSKAAFVKFFDQPIELKQEFIDI
jgi:putative transposase